MSKEVHIVPKVYAVNPLEFDRLRKKVSANLMARQFDVYQFEHLCKEKAVKPTLHRYKKWLAEQIAECAAHTYEQEIAELKAEYAKHHMEVV